MGKITHADVDNELSKTEWEAESTHKIGGVADLSIVTTATYVVAGSDAPAHVRALSNYKASDYASDDLAIQAALTAAGDYGYIKCFGTFTCSNAVVISKSYVTLDLTAAKLFTAASKSINLIEVTPDGADIYNPTIIGGLLDGNKANNTQGGNQYLQNGIMMLGTVSYAIFNPVVNHVRSINQEWHGMLIAGYTWYPQILVNTCDLCTGSGIRLDSTVWPIVKANKCESNADSGIYQEGGRWGIVSGNFTRNNTDYGIYALLLTSGGIISDNMCVIDEIGIYIMNSSGMTIKGNTILHTLTKTSGIRIEGNASGDANNNTIEGNTIDTSPLGIDIRGATGYTDDCIAQNNRFVACTVDVSNASVTSVVADVMPMSVALDLSGAATDVEVFHASQICTLTGYKVVYTEASSADAGVSIDIGRYQSGVALDDDYFDTSTSEVSKDLGYSKSFLTADLTNKTIAAGDTITVGTAGGKTGTGEVRVTLYIALGAA